MKPFVMISAAAGLVGMTVAASVPVLWYARMRRAEHQAAQTLAALREAQAAFRRAGGNSGYASDLSSLTTPCPGQTQAPLVVSRGGDADRYTFRVRAARGAAPVGQDCHGRATFNDYYAAAAPRGALEGRQALAMTSRGRIYVFFDGIAPLETDMGAGGLAVALDGVDRFKIP